MLRDFPCKYCAEPMTHLRERRVPTGRPGDEVKTCARLNDYKCPKCGAVCREGGTRNDDIWLTPAFLLAGR